jgi:hypothetical protein
MLISTRVRPVCALLVLGLGGGVNAQTTPGEGISRHLAVERAKVLSNLRYQYDVTLEKHAPRMQGHALIQFDTASTRDALFLDFRDIDSKGALIEGSARNLKVNGQPETITEKDGHLLFHRDISGGAGTSWSWISIRALRKPITRSPASWITKTERNTFIRSSSRWMRIWRFRVSISRI